ncbi:MAG: TonB-dependent receptor [Opitutaceae bacterium]|nr:TonB-dependent receptor [Opitutaceae bacterium]
MTVRTPAVHLRGEGIDGGVSILPDQYIITTGTNAQPVDMNPYDARDYDMYLATEDYGVYKTDLLAGRADVERVFGSKFSLKAGVAINRLEKDDRRIANNYTFTGSAGNTAASAYDLVDEAVTVQMNGRDVIWPSPVKAYDLFVAHQDWFSLNSTTFSNAAQNSKRMIEEISSAYLRFDLKLFQNRLALTGGVRFEKTELDGWSMRQDGFAVYQRDENGELLRDANGSLIMKPGLAADAMARYKLIYQERAHHEGQAYDGFYPSINASFTLTENMVLRAAYARTVGRPNVSYVVAGITIPATVSDADPDEARTITVGNPGLEPWTADSFHLSLDSYAIGGGYGSIGVYQKYVTNFFAQRAIPADEETLRHYNIPEEDMELMRNYWLRRWENVGDGRLTGVELSYRQDLLFFPAWLQKAQVWVNYTHLKVGGANTDDFVNFTPDIFSCGVNYIRPRYAVRLTCAYQAETKKRREDIVGTSGVARYPDGTYVYQGAYTKYGLTAEYAFSKAFILFANWDNVFGRDRYYYRRGPDTPDWAAKSQRYVIPSSIMLGVKGRF